MLARKFGEWEKEQEAVDDFVYKLKLKATARGIDLDELWDGYATIGKVCDDHMGPDSQLIIKNPKDGGEDFLVPIEEFFKSED